MSGAAGSNRQKMAIISALETMNATAVLSQANCSMSLR